MENSAYKSISEILEDVAAGRLTPEQGDLEIERLNQKQDSSAGSANAKTSRKHISGIWGGSIDFDISGSVSGVVGGSICKGVTIGGSISGPIGGALQEGVRSGGSSSGPIGGGIHNNVRIEGDLSGYVLED